MPRDAAEDLAIRFLLAAGSSKPKDILRRVLTKPGAYFPGTVEVTGGHVKVPGKKSVFVSLKAHPKPPDRDHTVVLSTEGERSQLWEFPTKAMRFPSIEHAVANIIYEFAKKQPVDAAPAPVQAPPKPSKAPAGPPELPVSEITSFLKSLDYGPGGRARSVDWEGGQYPGWSVEPSHRQRLDHYVGVHDSRDPDDDMYDPEGWDQDGWEEDYAGPLRARVQKALDARFGKGALSVEVGEKGHVEVEPNRKFFKMGKAKPKAPPGWKVKPSSGTYIVYEHESGRVRVQDTQRQHAERYQIIYRPGNRTVLVDGLLRSTPSNDWLEVEGKSSFGAAFNLAEATVRSLEDAEGTMKKKGTVRVAFDLNKAFERMAERRPDLVASGDIPMPKEEAGLKALAEFRTAKTNQQVIEAPHNFHPVELQPPQAKRKEHPFEGFIDFQGIKIDVENAKGSVRSGEAPDGTKWSSEMFAHYGEIRGTEGTDGDKLDVYVGDNHDSSIVVVIYQHNPWDGKYDEDKVMIGFDSVEEAIGAYKKQYDKPGYFKEGEFKAMPIGQFWRWVNDTRKKGKKVTGSLRVKTGAKKTASEASPEAQLMSVLAVLRGLSWTHWTNHWQASGTSSYGDHLLFERMYAGTTKEIDTLAEKMVGLFGPDSVNAVSQAHLVSTFLAGISGESCPFQRALDAEHAFQIALKETVKNLTAMEALSLGLDDFLRTLADDHETNLYLLQQRMHSGLAKLAHRTDRSRAFVARALLKRVAALAGTDTASFYVIAPEQLFHIVEDGGWADLGHHLWGHGESDAATLQIDMEDTIREHGGAVFHTGGDGFFDVKVEGSVAEFDYLPPYGTPEYAAHVERVARRFVRQAGGRGDVL